MGKIFTITPQIKKIAQDAIDDLIDQLGKDCRLIYPAAAADCPNCIFDFTTSRSSGKYKTGGPRPFGFGTICHVCRGTGRLQSETYEIIKMLCQWNPKEFYMPIANLPIQVPNSIVQTKGYITDLPKILRSRKMVMEVPMEAYIKYNFDLWGEPIDPGNIIQGRYFVATWKRAG